MLQLNNNVQGTKLAPMPVPLERENGTYQFPIVFFTKCEFAEHELKTGKKKGEKVPSLRLEFVTEDGKKGISELFMPIEEGEKSTEVRKSIVSQQLAHLAEVTGKPFDEKGIGGKDWASLYKNVEKYFADVVTPDITKADKKYFLKVTYGSPKYNSKNVALPAPNFLEVASGANPKTLSINPAYDVLKPKIDSSTPTADKQVEDDFPI